MKGLLFTLFCGALLMTLAPRRCLTTAGCATRTFAVLMKVTATERTEMAQGKGQAKGADTYVSEFAKGRPNGKGVYTWRTARAWSEASRKAKLLP
jgi:hypothetical protein